MTNHVIFLRSITSKFGAHRRNGLDTATLTMDCSAGTVRGSRHVFLFGNFLRISVIPLLKKPGNYGFLLFDKKFSVLRTKKSGIMCLEDEKLRTLWNFDEFSVVSVKNYRIL